MTFATKYSPEISKLILSYTINELTSSEFFQNINIILEKAKDENLLSEEMAFVMFSVCKFIRNDRIVDIPMIFDNILSKKDTDFFSLIKNERWRRQRSMQSAMSYYRRNEEDTGK